MDHIWVFDKMRCGPAFPFKVAHQSFPKYTFCLFTHISSHSYALINNLPVFQGLTHVIYHLRKIWVEIQNVTELIYQNPWHIDSSLPSIPFLFLYFYLIPLLLSPVLPFPFLLRVGLGGGHWVLLGRAAVPHFTSLNIFVSWIHKHYLPIWKLFI